MLNSLDFQKNPRDVRVVVAMSGGVDSSVVAGLLVQEGYDVIGITLQLYDHGKAIGKKGTCCAGRDIHDARRVCKKLGIPHYVLDYQKRFHEAVINPFTNSYVAGETPVPCILCNQTVKFSDLLKTARELDATALATGHYIRSRIIDPLTGRRALYCPHDSSRDQSYFLFATTQEQIDYLRFPLGDLPKSRTRELAQEMGLSVANKSDSQDICFVPQGKYSDLVSKLHPNAVKSGKIIHINGDVVGNHNGIIHYTLGQRRGIGISTGEPVYVIYLNHEKSQLIVGPHEALATHSIMLRNVNWLGDKLPEELPKNGLEIYVKVRSTSEPVAACLLVRNNKFQVIFMKPEHGIAPGQACVFYEDNSPGTRILGGGWILCPLLAPQVETAIEKIKTREF